MDLRGQAALLTGEIVAVVAVALVALPIPAQVPLVVVAMISYAARGLRWESRFDSDRFRLGLGAATGAAALILALAVIGPALEARGGMITWSHHAAVRGKPEVLVSYLLIVTALAVATELILRGWILERALGLGRGATGAAIAIAVTGFVEAVYFGEPGWSAVGASLFGVALSGLYLATGRSLVAPIAARVTFEVGILLLESFKLVN